MPPTNFWTIPIQHQSIRGGDCEVYQAVHTIVSTVASVLVCRRATRPVNEYRFTVHKTTQKSNLSPFIAIHIA